MKNIRKEIVKMRIPIVMVTDARYILQTRITIWTMRKNTSEETTLDITILCAKELKADARCKLYELERKFSNLKIRFYEVDSKIFQEAKPQAHIPIASFYRLIIAEVLEDEKCLFLDGDLIVNTDLNDLYSEDMEDFYIAGVRDLGFIANPDGTMRHFKKYDFAEPINYVNAGVMVFNLSKLRQCRLQRQFLECMKVSYPYMDQDILNKVCGSKIKLLDWKYNCFNRCTNREFLLQEENQSEEKWKILHFAGKYKPWNNLRLRGAKEWWKWAREALNDDEYIKMYEYAEKITRETDWSYIIRRCLEKEDIIVIGYSDIGMGVFRTLKEYRLHANIYMCDNSKEKQKLSNEYIRIYPMEELSKIHPNALWINTSQKKYMEINDQLNMLGICQEEIVWYMNKGEPYFAVLDDEYFAYELEEIRLKKTGCG